MIEARHRYKVWDTRNSTMYLWKDILVEPHILTSALAGEKFLTADGEPPLIPLQYSSTSGSEGGVICEGDVIQDCEGNKRLIVWAKVYSGHMLTEMNLPSGHIDEYYGGIDGSFSKIIGNRYENPELLEGLDARGQD